MFAALFIEYFGIHIKENIIVKPKHSSIYSESKIMENHYKL